MVEEIKVVHVGLGPIGAQIARYIVNEREGISYVGAVDINPEIVGRDLGEVIGIGKSLNIKVSNDLKALFEEARPDIAIYTTVSSVREVFSQMRPAIESGVDVISTAEKLAFPNFTERELTKEYDELAKNNDVSILGSGINPGFLMDLWPKILSTGCVEVNRVEVKRCMNASPRRKPFQKKIGVSMKPTEFKEAIESGAITGHVGLEESISLIANGLGWNLGEIRVGAIKAVIAEKEVSSKFYTAKEGEVKGIRQEAYGVVGGNAKIQLSFTAFLGAKLSYDEVKIEGTPEINVKVSPCWHGDYGTAAMVVNLIPTVLNAPPGVLTINDIVPISFKSGNVAKFVK
ncbi:MAG: dihydrodipicolinate reductase [Candidatus Aerophobetes bacterium]|nr:dihydrodipicolinate reductase [Candidatus Aerophobetes bacterium]